LIELILILIVKQHNINSV